MESFKMLFFKSMNIDNEDLETLIDVMIIIMESSISPGSLYKALPAIAQKMGPLFNLPPHVVGGLIQEGKRMAEEKSQFSNKLPAD